jgi:hypothetical protein
MSRLDGVVACSGGWLVAQRGARSDVRAPSLQVVGVAPVRPPDTAPVEVRRSDDHVWRRHWLDRDRLVIDFVDVAMVEVGGSTVVFDRELPDDMEQHLLFDHVLPLVLARDGRLVLHGGVVSRGARGAVLVGATGAGKSTLTAYAWQQGWTVGGDDGSVLFTTDPPTVEPTYATLRLTPASADLLGIDLSTSSSVVGKMRIAGTGRQAFHQGAVELRLIAVIEPVDGDGASFEPIRGIEAHARLFGSTFHADLSADHLLPAMLEQLATVVETTTVGRLAVPRGVAGLAAAERLLRELVDATGERGAP